jgi:hypothetical protein
LLRKSDKTRRWNRVVSYSVIHRQSRFHKRLGKHWVTYRINGALEIFIQALGDAKDPLYNDAPLVLKELNDPAVLPALREALSTNDPDMVAACAFALGEFRDTQAVVLLMKTCKNYSF